MEKPLRALLIDDSPEDTELLVHHLRRNGYAVEWERVDTAAALQAALGRGKWQVALCDYVMPQFSGPEALRILRAAAPDLPAIVVSGQVGEEYAVTVMRAGAHDYVNKNNMARLVPAIERELSEAEERRRRRSSEAVLEKTETWLAVAVAAASLGLWDVELDTGVMHFST